MEENLLSPSPCLYYGLNKDVINMINNYRVSYNCKIHWDKYYLDLNNQTRNLINKIDGELIRVCWDYDNIKGSLCFRRETYKHSTTIDLLLYYLNKKKPYLKGDELYNEIKLLFPSEASLYIQTLKTPYRVIYNGTLGITLTFADDGSPVFAYCTYYDSELDYMQSSMTIPPFTYPYLATILEDLKTHPYKKSNNP